MDGLLKLDSNEGFYSIEQKESFPKHHSSPFYDHNKPRYREENEFHGIGYRIVRDRGLLCYGL